MLRPFVHAAAALAALLTASAASAQEAPPISPLRVETDHNGVNIIDGRIMMPAPILSVPAAPRLRYDRAGNASPLARGHSYADLHSTWSIHTGTGKSEQFECDGDEGGQVCTSAVGTGSFFRPGTHAYKPAGTGEVWTFNQQRTHSYSTNGTAEAWSASSVSYADGERIDYSYEGAYFPGTTTTTFRPTRLDDNLGYYIQLTYQSADPDSPGWNTVATASLYATANPSTPLQQLTYSGDSITQVGSDGASRTAACTGCTLTLGVSDLETTSGASTFPGEAAPALQVNRGTTDLVSSVVRDGVTWTYTYTNVRVGSSGTYIYDKVTVGGPNGYHQVYDIAVYEGTRNVIAAITDSLNRKTTIDFDLAYQPTRMVLPELNEVSVLYDEKGNIYSKTTKAKPGSGLPDLVETASYPLATCTAVLCFRPDWSKDALGRQTDFVWNGSGQLVEQTDPADAQGVRKKTYIEYEAVPYGLNRRKVVRVCGDVTTCGTANEIRTEYDYWGSTGLPSVERRIDAAAGVTLTTTYTYDAAGRTLVVDGPLAGTDDATYFRYDGWGRKIWEIGPKGANGLRNARKFTYRDSDDKVTATESGTVADPASPTLTPLDRTYVAYDAHRNPVREAVSSGTTTYGLTERSFDDRGQPICQAQRMNSALFAATTDACQLAQPEGSQGPDRITHNVYDAAGQLLQIQKAYLTSLQQNYATYEYTPNGTQKAVIDANGNRAEATFDGYDRQRRWIFPSPTTAGVANQADYEEYGYDAIGNRTSLRKRDGVTLTYQYDNHDRLRVKTVPASATGAAGYSVYFGYDVSGLQTYARFGSDSGPGITNAYDGLGRQTSTTTNMDGTARTISSQYDLGSRRIHVGATTGYAMNFGYDAAGNATSLYDGNNEMIVQFGYDSAGRRQTLALGPGGSSPVSYGYDAAGRLQSLTHDLAGTASDQALTFGYNPASQMVTRTSSNDAYASNTAYNVNRGYSVNGLNQYTAAGGVTFQYDANGNLTSDGSNTYVYDAENRLVSRSGGVSLAYDPLGRLWQLAAPTGTTRFEYDGDRLLEEFNTAGAWVRLYAWGSSTDEPLIWYEGTGGPVRRFLHADHQGSIIAVVDDSGNPIALNGYDAWGIPNAANGGRFQYTGQAWFAELGMYYYKARIYSPTLGRFLQTDPVGFEGGLDLYAYVGNDPVNLRDSTGLTAEVPVPGCGTHFSGQSTSGCLSYSSVETSDEPKHRPAPIQLAQVEEENGRRGSLGLEADPNAETKIDQFSTAIRHIQQLEPNNPIATYVVSDSRTFVPTWDQVGAAQAEAREVQNRAQVIDYAKASGGAAQPGYRGGGVYRNDGRGGTITLPGRGVTFREYDVRPYVPGVNRGAERIIIDSRGRAYYTGDHYILFRRIR